MRADGPAGGRCFRCPWRGNIAVPMRMGNNVRAAGDLRKHFRRSWMPPGLRPFAHDGTDFDDESRPGGADGLEV